MNQILQYILDIICFSYYSYYSTIRHSQRNYYYIKLLANEQNTRSLP